MQSPKHQSIVLNLAILLRTYARSEGKNGKVLVAPTPVKLWEGKFREPDLMYFLPEHANRILERHTDPPDLAVEIVSPSARALDMADKLQEYARGGELRAVCREKQLERAHAVLAADAGWRRLQGQDELVRHVQKEGS